MNKVEKIAVEENQEYKKKIRESEKKSNTEPLQQRLSLEEIKRYKIEQEQGDAQNQLLIAKIDSLDIQKKIEVKRHISKASFYSMEARKFDDKLALVKLKKYQDEAVKKQKNTNSAENLKFIIAPHNVKEEQINSLYEKIHKTKLKYSNYSIETLRKPSPKEYQVFVINTVGILTKIYSYADIAYVGGGFGNPGVHNILEPATFGIPIVIGPNYSHFAEAIALVNMEGCVSISNQNELNETLSTLISNEDICHEKGHICSTFVQMNKGATDVILNHLDNDNL